MSGFMEPIAPGRPAERIAVIRALALGDMLCAVPTLRALRHAHPHARITLIGLPWAAAFVDRYRNLVDEHATFPGWPGIPEMPVAPVRTTQFLEAVQAHGFDMVVQLQGDGLASNAFAVLLGGRHTVGFVPPDRPEPPGPGTWVRYDPRGHEIHRLLRLAPAFGSGHSAAAAADALELPVHSRDRLEAASLLADAGIGAEGYAVVHPGSSDAGRRWPVEDFARVVRVLRDGGLRIVLTGVASEASLTGRLASAARGGVLDLAGRTSLGGLAALVEGARLVVANDTGVAHVAAALRTPSVVIFTGSDPARWAALDASRHTAVGEGTTVPGAHGVRPDADEVIAAVRARLGSFPLATA